MNNTLLSTSRSQLTNEGFDLTDNGFAEYNSLDAFQQYDTNYTITENIRMQILADEQIAKSLINLDDFVEEEEKEVEDSRRMRMSISGTAILLVNRFIEQIQDVLLCYPEFIEQIGPVGVDGMVSIAERLIETKNRMTDTYFDPDDVMIDLTVDIGYHYTDMKNLNRISMEGLLNRTEQQQYNDKLPSYRTNNAAFGDGIYTANNAFVFQKYGNIGLLVARLKGKIVEYDTFESSIVDLHEMPNYDTISANKRSRSTISHYWEEQILSHSSQCIPIVQYDASIIQKKFDVTDENSNSSLDESCYNRGNCCIVDLHERLQQVIDELLNDGIPTKRYH
jgi:hypothetical protein